VFTLDAAAIRAISWYQAEISPSKGFVCAHRVHTGGLSCSAFAKQSIYEHGLLVGLCLFVGQTRRCHASAKALRRLDQQETRPPDAAPEPVEGKSDDCVNWIAMDAGMQTASCCLLSLIC
jgi:putative component of membrane protein insertase Oxa1/YidC/SpoIIIJ protein YidD